MGFMEKEAQAKKQGNREDHPRRRNQRLESEIHREEDNSLTSRAQAKD
jgi:hypothetical protein